MYFKTGVADAFSSEILLIGPTEMVRDLTKLIVSSCTAQHLLLIY